MQVGEELAVDEIAEVVAGQGRVVVEFAVLVLGCGPASPSGRACRGCRRISFRRARPRSALSCFEAVEVFQEQQPGSLLGVIQLGGAAGLLAEHVVDVPEGLFEHSTQSFSQSLLGFRAAFLGMKSGPRGDRFTGILSQRVSPTVPVCPVVAARVSSASEREARGQAIPECGIRKEGLAKRRYSQTDVYK